MKSFQIYLKEKPDPSIVKAEKYLSKTGWLHFVIGDQAVASFKLAEVQGWQEIRSGR